MSKELSDRAEAVLWVINGTIPAASVDKKDGRDMLATRSGIRIDVAKLAADIATFLDWLDELPRATCSKCQKPIPEGTAEFDLDSGRRIGLPHHAECSHT